MITILHNMAHISLQADDIKQARELLQEAFQLAQETKDAMGLYHVSIALGGLFLQEEILKKAETFF